MRPPIPPPSGEVFPALAMVPPASALLQVGPYHSSFGALLRSTCKLNIVTVSNWLWLVGSSLFIAGLEALHPSSGGPLRFLMAFGIHMLLLWLVVFLVNVIICALYYRKTKQVTTFLLADSILDQSNTRQTELKWKDVRALRLWGGDFIAQAGQRGILVPRENFQDTEQALQFFEKARELREQARAER